MAVAVYHEDNQAKWVGVRPAHGGVQVSVAIANTIGDHADEYTVDDGKVLLINAVTWGIRKLNTTAYLFAIQLTTAGNVVQFNVVHATASAIEPQTGSVAFPLPYELIAGYKVRSYSTNGNLQVYGGIHGFLIDA